MSSTLWFCHASRMHFSLHKEMCANSTCFPQPLQDPTLHSLLLWKVTCPPPSRVQRWGLLETRGKICCMGGALPMQYKFQDKVCGQKAACTKPVP